MMRLLRTFLVLLLWPSIALAQIQPVGPPAYVVPGPFPYTPLTPGQYNLAPVSSTALTVPAGAAYATICAETATVRYTTDKTTTPTASVGVPLAAGICTSLSGATVLSNFRAFSSSGTLDIEYFK